MKAREDRCFDCAPLALSWLIFAAIWFPLASANGQTYSVEQARKEGEVVLYSTITVGAFNELNKAIKEKYSFLDVRHIRLGPAQQLARIMQEQRAGHFLADVVYNNLLHLTYLKENGVLGKYESPENRFLIKEAIDSDGYWVGGDIDVLVTGFNTNMISRKDVPTTYDGFLDGKLKRQMAINSNNPYALVGMASLRGEEQGITYMKTLVQQNLRPVQGFTHMANLLAAGEYPIALFSQVTKIERDERKESSRRLGLEFAQLQHGGRLWYQPKLAASGRSEFAGRLRALRPRAENPGTHRQAAHAPGRADSVQEHR
jgi:ABC-type thiamine transport system substrate-binding protein